MQLKVISPEKVLLDTLVDLVELPGTQGRFQVLHNHAPLVSSLTAGVVSYVPARGDDSSRLTVASGSERRPSLPVKGGFVEVLDNVITVCVE